jgi:hypothetical protein
LHVNTLHNARPLGANGDPIRRFHFAVRRQGADQRLRFDLRKLHYGRRRIPEVKPEPNGGGDQDEKKEQQSGSGHFSSEPTSLSQMGY